MNHLRPKIPGGAVALVDTLVKSLYRSVDGAGTVLLDEFTRCLVYRCGHRLPSIRQ
jgi:hypothetical protein